MKIISNSIALQYQGYLNTPLLWKDHHILGLQQYEIQNQTPALNNETMPDHLLLGKRVERFIHSALQQQKNVNILLANTQIQHKKITIGEIDFLFQQDGIPMHVEVIYKFYLYDSSMGNKEIDHWIGPNRKDTLVKKLYKLKEKQLPLLYSKYTEHLLKNFNLDAEDILQRVNFKAQLFTPYQKDVDFDVLNKDCLKGFYIHFSDIQQFDLCTFYIPIKVNWLIEVQVKAPWMTYDQFYKKIKVITNEKRAPLCWIKFPNGELQKFFVVWWRDQWDIELMR